MYFNYPMHFILVTKALNNLLLYALALTRSDFLNPLSTLSYRLCFIEVCCQINLHEFVNLLNIIFYIYRSKNFPHC